MPRLSEAEGGKIKPAGFQQGFTQEQAAEIIRCTHDPVYFIEKYVYIEHPTKGSVPFKLFDFQRNLIRVYNENRRTIAMLSRQCGKTTTAAGYLLWWAIFKDNQKILIASKDQDGAKEIMDRLWYAYEELPWWIKPGVKTDQVHTKKFDNSSVVRATATTKTSGRGKSNSLIYLDEFAFVAPGIANDFWTAIYPTLSTGGKCIITSTPNTDEDKFASVWFNCEMSPRSDPWKDAMADRMMAPAGFDNEDDYETIFEDEALADLYDDDMDEEDDEEAKLTGFMGFHAHWTKVPDDFDPSGFRGKKFKKETIKAGLTLEEWLREYECAFVTGDTTLISPSKLAVLRQYVRKPRFIDRWGCRWYEEIKPNQAYGVILDPSEGVDRDDACIQVWEIPQLRQVAEWNDNQSDQPEQARMLRRILKRLYVLQQSDMEHMGGDVIYYSVERNGLGIGILNLIEQNVDAFPGWLVDATATTINLRGSKGGLDAVNHYRGLLTSMSTKKRFCIEFKSLVERNMFIPRSQWLISQMKTFVKKGQSWQAKEGCKDDIIMSSVLMCQLVEEIRHYEPDLDEYMDIDIAEHNPDDIHDPMNQAMAPIV